MLPSVIVWLLDMKMPGLGFVSYWQLQLFEQEGMIVTVENIKTFHDQFEHKNTLILK